MVGEGQLPLTSPKASEFRTAPQAKAPSRLRPLTDLPAALPCLLPETRGQFSTTLVLTSTWAEPTITLVAVASSGLTEFLVASLAECPQAHSVAEYCSERGTARRLALAPVSQPGEADGSALGRGPPGLGRGRAG